MDEPPPPSQASTHFILEPIPASIIAEAETRRRDANRKVGTCRTGCVEVDESVLLGGFERGCVVGMSSEEEDFGTTVSYLDFLSPFELTAPVTDVRLQFAFQLLAHSLCEGSIKTAHVVTPKPQAITLAALRDGLRAELATQETASTGGASDEGKMRECLDKVMLSCVFDMTGAWEVLADMDRSASPYSSPSPVLEIEDSQDDEDTPPHPPKLKTREQKTPPDIIIIAHFGVLLTELFTHRTSQAAHSTLQLLSSHLRHLSRSLSSNPLILLLNSTTTTSDSKSSKPLDPTLRSIFNPPPLPGYTHTASSRVNKPHFGLVFSQMLDIHILCTMVPRTGADVVFGQGRGAAAFVTVVEVLLDEIGVWGDQGSNGGSRKRGSREQRWGAVVLRQGRLVNAFEKKEKKVYGEVRLAAGFGGPRV